MAHVIELVACLFFVCVLMKDSSGRILNLVLHMAAGRKYVPKMESWYMDTLAKTCRPIPGALKLILKRAFARGRAHRPA